MALIGLQIIKGLLALGLAGYALVVTFKDEVRR
jgi:hypothetical protein